MDRRKRHGAMTLGLAALAIALAASSAFRLSPILGAVYMGLAALSIPAILLAYCAKCPDRDDCGHVLPGRAASALRKRKTGPYSKPDLAVTAAALFILFALPQAWLWKKPADALVFLAAMVMAAWDVRLWVCKDCGNRHCPGNRLYKKGKK